ncbi:MAG: glycosyltransferase family 4 protein [Candidatus Acidiferrum sp.]
MKILVAHNFYQSRGGEDAVCESEIGLLREAGHQVIEYLRHNNEIHEHSFFEKVSLGWCVSWSDRANRELRDILFRESPDVAHFHNTFPLISPSAYYACHAAGVPVVQTLHNFRLLCPSATLFRSGRICEECVDRSLFRSILHACYHDSRIETSALAGMLAVHRQLRTWSEQVALFLVCSDFARQKFVAAGFDASLIRVKPNFLAPDPGARICEGHSALFIGRLSPEKGPQLLPAAWSKLVAPIPLEIVGDGLLLASLQGQCARLGLRNVHFSGWLDARAAIERLRAAKFLIVPSLCYEGFPLVVAEAYACGVPIIAAGHGGLAEIIRNGSTGLHFTPGDADDLAEKVAWAWTHTREMAVMGRAARADFETKYTAAVALDHLHAAYDFALCRQDRSALAAKVFAPTEPPSLAARQEKIG